MKRLLFLKAVLAASAAPVVMGASKYPEVGCAEKMVYVPQSISVNPYCLTTVQLRSVVESGCHIFGQDQAYDVITESEYQRRHKEWWRH